MKLNNVVINGRITEDPEVGYTGLTKTAYCRFSIAVRNNYRDKDGNYGTQFFDCNTYAAQAEYIGKWVHKGDMLLVKGSLAVQNYQDKDGKVRKDTYIKVEDIENLSFKNQQEQEKPQPSDTPQKTPQHQSNTTNQGMMGNQMLDDESNNDALPWL